MSKLTRRDFLKEVGAGVAGASLLGLAPGGVLLAASEGKPPPNIVLFLGDDHGWADAGCYGDKIVQTPAIDRLARQGMRFTHAFAASPTCVPSRSSIYTGLMPFRHGAHPNHSTMRRGVKTLPRYFQELGYRCVLANKMDIYTPEKSPFEILRARKIVNPQEKAGWMRWGLDTKALEPLLGKPGDKPLLLVIASNEPHVPWPQTPAVDPARIVLPPYLEDTPQMRQRVARYYTDVATLDREVADVLAMLDKHGLSDRTIFVYSSDQGPQLPHGKWELYDAGIRVPMIVRWPEKVMPGSTCDALVSHVDLLPTLMEAAGGEAPPAPRTIDGMSYLPLLRGKAGEHRSEIFATHTADNKLSIFPMRCCRTRTHKYIRNLVTQNKGFFRDRTAAREVGGKWVWPEEELYDLRTDPSEMKNIAGDPAQTKVLEDLRKKVVQWRQQQGDTESPSGV